MSENVTEVQTRFQEVHKSAVYVYCHAHRLNSVNVNVARGVRSAGELFSLIEMVYAFVTRHKVYEVFVRIQREPGLIVREIGRLSDTRWAYIAVIDDVITAVLTELSKLRRVSDIGKFEP